MSEKSPTTRNSDLNPRTTRAVAAILSQTATDRTLQELNKADGRNQSEQASYLDKQNPFLREIYEQGGTVRDGLLTIPKENLDLSPEIKITSLQTAVDRLTVLTGDPVRSRELAPQLVAMGKQIAGSGADGETSLKVFNWLYQSLEGKQDLLPNEFNETREDGTSKVPFSEKWQQITELSEALTALEPKDQLPETSLDMIIDRENGKTIGEQEIFGDSEIFDQSAVAENTEESYLRGNLIGFERIKVNSGLPKIPESLSFSDVAKLLDKTVEIDSQLERGEPLREILAPFRGYLELTKRDNELRLIEEEYLKVQQLSGKEKDLADNRFVPTREELRELSEDRQTVLLLSAEQIKLQENIRLEFDGSVDRQKIESSLGQKIELTEEEIGLKRLLVKEKNLAGEIQTLNESIADREKGFRSIHEMTQVKLNPGRQKELTEKVLAMEFPVTSVLKEKYPDLSQRGRNEKLVKANTFEIRNPTEYVFVSEAANRHFLKLQAREIKNEYRRFDQTKNASITDPKLERQILKTHRETIKSLVSAEPKFTYQIEGSNRLLNAKASERAFAGYNFAHEYIHYQLQQPETRLRRESPVYRQYAESLESVKTSEELIRLGYRIRRENHQATGKWKNAALEERGGLPRPLTKNEMTMLFLEPPPRHYNGEMSLIKYNFAHYSQAKNRMTEALENGKMEPSPEAQKLVASLQSRLGRQTLRAKQKATGHFFQSLNTPNEKLVLKNQFDHQAFYQKLAPHEKDWVYRSALSQKENLAYRIAFEQARKDHLIPGSPKFTEATAENRQLREDFAAGTLWHQAGYLSRPMKTNDFKNVEASVFGETLNTVGFLIHNQSQANNLRITRWLEKQTSAEMKTAGEILQTFARANRQIEGQELLITVTIPDQSKVSSADYKNLFTAYFPTEFEKHQEFLFGKNEQFKLESSRRHGQSVMLDSWINETQTSVYRPESPVKVFENEQLLIREVEKIKAAQIEARRAQEIKNAVILNIAEKTQIELDKRSKNYNADDLQSAVKSALTAENSEGLKPRQKILFQIAQEKISLADFEKFTLSSQNLEKRVSEINQSFQTIAELQRENSPYIIRSEKGATIDSLQELYETKQKEAEMNLISIAVRQKFLNGELTGKTELLSQSISPEELDKAHFESHRQARIFLEPVELNESLKDPKIEMSALEFADALEAAHQMKLEGSSASSITAGFAVAEEKRENLRLAKGNQSAVEPEVPVTLKIYERELVRQEKAIARTKISKMIETGEISTDEMETKKAVEIFSAAERQEIRLEAGMRTRENLEPKELWAKRQDISESLQDAALQTSDSLEQAHEIFHTADASPEKIRQAFTALDSKIIKLKKERQNEKTVTRFNNFKFEFKRDLAQMFENSQNLENKELLASMTKGLLLNALEKQDVEAGKIGLSPAKLSEISRTIVFSEPVEKNREQGFLPNKNAPTENHREQTKAVQQKQTSPVKIRQFEHSR